MEANRLETLSYMEANRLETLRFVEKDRVAVCENEILIGMSGYDYPEWKGVFYPDDLKRSDFLLYYSTVFNALELNNTFYNMPTAERIKSFYERSEGRLSFSVKANRLLTHEIGRDWKERATEFQSAVVPLLEKSALCAVLFQFPESFHYTKENRFYLADLISSFKDFPCVVEVRHRDWVRESVFEGLSERGAGIVFCDVPRLKNLPNMLGGGERTPFVGNCAYIRLHGRNAGTWYAHVPKAQTSIISNYANGANATYCHDSESNGSARYRYDYSDEELREFVPIVTQAAREGNRTAVFFNNHPDGSGAKNARKFAQMCGEREKNSATTRTVPTALAFQS